MTNPRKVLIIKTGFSEFLDRGISTTISLGDVLIATAILHRFKNDSVTWVTSFKGSPLLKDNPYIDTLLIFGLSTFETIKKSSFDVLINLEKDIGICMFLSYVKAKKKFGFYFDQKKHDIATFNRSAGYLLSGQENHASIRKPILSLLFETIGEKWDKEVAILKTRSNIKEKYDIGFNFTVGPKWPTKAWPMDNWQALEKILKRKYSVSWQQGHKNISSYIRWITSCRLIVTCDSLGQVVGQALGKKVITLFGPTNHLRMNGIPNTRTIQSPLACPYMPCYLPVCKFERFCMDELSPQMVARECERLMEQINAHQKT